ncbi:hypothetical protein COOONC_11523, partial [Cooperia oncophora]
MVHSRRSEETDESKLFSTTGQEDSRVSFALHDLTGPVVSSRQERELMEYMDVDNLDFDVARRHAPKDNEQTYTGTIQDVIFCS